MSETSGLYNWPLDALGAKTARDELGEIESDRDAAVAALREWVVAQSSWLKSPTDTQFLLSFLRHRKYSQKAAKERLILYWKFRTEIPEWFSSISTRGDKLRRAFNEGMFLLLPQIDKDGCCVFICRSALVDIKGGVEEMHKQFTTCGVMMDLMLRQDMTQVCGIKALCDFTGMGTDHVMKLADGFMKKMNDMCLRCYPLRIRSVHYYNVGAVFDLFFGIIKPILPKKINERTFVHKSMKTVYDVIDKSILPREYLPDDYTGPHGGTIKEIIENYIKEIEKDTFHDYIAMLSSGEFYCDDKKRPDDAIPAESFRALQL